MKCGFTTATQQGIAMASCAAAVRPQPTHDDPQHGSTACDMARCDYPNHHGKTLHLTAQHSFGPLAQRDVIRPREPNMTPFLPTPDPKYIPQACEMRTYKFGRATILEAFKATDEVEGQQKATQSAEATVSQQRGRKISAHGGKVAWLKTSAGEVNCWLLTPAIVGPNRLGIVIKMK
eukprot:superscaffoldBa00001477_g10728